jgi:hypothetical protein
MLSAGQGQPKSGNLLLVDANPTQAQKLRQQLSAVQIKLVAHYKSLDEWTSQITDTDYQIVWVDLPEHETLFAGDWLDYLISRKLLTPKQLLVLVCHDSQILQLAMDYPYHNIVCLEHPWSIAIAEKSISQFFRLCSVLQPIQGLANVMRYSDALKLITYQLTKQPDPVLLQHLHRIQLHVLAETRQLPPVRADERVLSFESWLHFRQWYHNEPVDTAIALLLKPGLQLNKNAERQDSYLLYLHLLKGDIAGAFDLASHIPAQKQTSRLLRLIHLTAMLAGQHEFAAAVLQKKRRLHTGRHAGLLCDLMEARAIAYAGHQLLAQRQSLPAGFTLRLQQLTASTVTAEVNPPAFYELLLLRAELALFKGDRQTAVEALQQCPWQQRDLLLVPVWCHAAMLAAVIEQDDLSRQAVWAAFEAMFHAPESCQRVFALCLVQQTVKMLPGRLRDLAVWHRQLAETTDVWALAELTFFCAVGTNAVQDIRHWVKPLGFSRWHGVALD